jgi:uncharacterized protein
MSNKQSKIPVRRPGFNFTEDYNRYWFKDNILLTHMLNSLHIVFPAGERFFVNSLKTFEKDVTDEILRKRIKNFIGQETQHGMQHEKFWDTLEKQGLHPTEYANWYAEHAYTHVQLNTEKALGTEISLAVTAALEHYTAALAEVATELEIWNDMPEELADLLRWHALEELEHKSVSYDVLKAVKVNYTMRTLGLVIGSLSLGYYTAAGMIHFFQKDNNKSTFKIFRDLPVFLQSFGRVSLKVAPIILKYLDPDFHPDQISHQAHMQKLKNELSKNSRIKDEVLYEKPA